MARKFLSIEDGNLESTTFTTRKSRDYSDIDLSFTAKPGPAGVDLKGDIYKKTGGEAVKQAIKTLLLTNEFEKPFQPRFGAGLREMLFELNDGISGKRIELMIEQKIKMFEPRAQVELVNVKPQADTHRIDIEVIFNIVNTQETVQFTTTLNRLR